MTVNHVLAVVPVTDIHAADDWYQRLFGRGADNHPMETLAEWQVTENGWLQVSADAGGAGTALVNFAVDDLPAHLAELRGRGLDPGAVDTVTKGVQLSAISDPDGNRITFIGNFRVRY